MGLPLATEALDPISPQYMQDCISWSAIGARTTESQTHREMASGLSCPVGFKNGTDGSLDVAINALQSVASPHNFLGINQAGQVAIIRTRGNAYGHVVLRGGNGKPNYDSVSVALAEKELEKAKLSPNIMIDCSHANSNKDAALQPLVFTPKWWQCVQQRLPISTGNHPLIQQSDRPAITLLTNQAPAGLHQFDRRIRHTNAHKRVTTLALYPFC